LDSYFLRQQQHHQRAGANLYGSIGFVAKLDHGQLLEPCGNQLHRQASGKLHGADGCGG
jgi:hypothetical protein